jgi:hypothetical protein
MGHSVPGRYKYGDLALQVGDSRIWESKIWWWVLWILEPRMPPLASVSSNFKRSTRPLVKEGAKHKHTRSYLPVLKIWSWASDGGLTPRQTGRLAVDRNINWTSIASEWQLVYSHGSEVDSWSKLVSSKPIIFPARTVAQKQKKHPLFKAVAR